MAVSNLERSTPSAETRRRFDRSSSSVRSRRAAFTRSISAVCARSCRSIGRRGDDGHGRALGLARRQADARPHLGDGVRSGGVDSRKAAFYLARLRYCPVV